MSARSPERQQPAALILNVNDALDVIDEHGQSVKDVRFNTTGNGVLFELVDGDGRRIAGARVPVSEEEFRTFRTACERMFPTVTFGGERRSRPRQVREDIASVVGSVIEVPETQDALRAQLAEIIAAAETIPDGIDRGALPDGELGDALRLILDDPEIAVAHHRPFNGSLWIRFGRDKHTGRGDGFLTKDELATIEWFCKQLGRAFHAEKD